MTPLAESAKHEASIRSVVDIAREVRIHLRDAQVIFGSIAPAARDMSGSFRIKPWGVNVPVEIRFTDVTVASPVKQMAWANHRAIAVAQQAGIFVNPRPLPTTRHR
jgi:hypothetical protein